MKHLKQRFVQIMQIELDDLKDDIEHLIEQEEQEKDSGKITKYVYLENLVVLKNELLGIGDFSKLLSEIDCESATPLDEVINAIENSFHSLMKKCGIAPALEPLIKRKIDKVRKYVTDIN